MEIITVIFNNGNTQFLPICLESVKESDNIVFCDFEENKELIDYLESNGFTKFNVTFNGEKRIIYNPWETESKQRNFYLNHLKNTYPKDTFILCIDCDEVLDNFSKIREFCKINQSGAFSLRIRHLIGDLGKEEYGSSPFYSLHRLFKLGEVNYYTNKDNPTLLLGRNATSKVIKDTIWSLKYCSGINYLFKNMSKDYEEYKERISGNISTQRVNPKKLPQSIKAYFQLE